MWSVRYRERKIRFWNICLISNGYFLFCFHFFFLFHFSAFSPHSSKSKHSLFPLSQFLDSFTFSSMDSKQFDRASRKVRVVARIRGFSVGPEANSEPSASRAVEWVSVNRENLDDVTISFGDQSSRYCYCSAFEFCSFGLVNFVESGNKLIEFWVLRVFGFWIV